MRDRGKQGSFFFVAVAAAIAIAITAACSPGSSTGGKVTLTWFMRTDTNENAWENAQIAAYESSHPNVDVNLIAVPNTTVYDTKINTLLNSSTPPDLFQPLGQTGFASYKHRDVLMDITSLAQSYDWTGVPQSARDTYTVDGKLYGIPAITLGSFLYYNKDLFDRYNKTHADQLALPPVDWNDTSWTFDKMEAVATKLTDKSAHTYGVLDALYPVNAYAWMAGQEPFTPSAGVPKDFNITAPATVALFQQIADWYKKGISPAQSEQAAARNAGLDLFVSGKVAMVLTGGWGFRNYNDVKFHWGAAALPLDVKRADPTFTDAYVIPKAAKHPSEAFDLIKFLTAQASMESYINKVAFTPVNQNYLDPWYQHVASVTGMSTSDLQTVMKGAVANGQPASDHVVVSFGEIFDKMTQDLQPLWLGQQSAAQALQHVQTDVNEVIRTIS